MTRASSERQALPVSQGRLSRCCSLTLLKPKEAAESFTNARLVCNQRWLGETLGLLREARPANQNRTNSPESAPFPKRNQEVL